MASFPVKVRLETKEEVETRRFSLQECSYLVLYAKIQQLFGIAESTTLQVTWVDDDDEVIHVSSDEELKEAFANCNITKCLKLTVKIISFVVYDDENVSDAEEDEMVTIPGDACMEEKAKFSCCPGDVGSRCSIQNTCDDPCLAEASALIVGSVEPIDLRGSSDSTVTDLQGPQTSSCLTTLVDSLCPNASTSHVYMDLNGPWSFTLNQEVVDGNPKFFIGQLLEQNNNCKDGSNDKIYRFWTRWGRIGNEGQSECQEGSFDVCERLFLKKFHDKTRNQWNERADFQQQPGKYDMMEQCLVDTSIAQEDASSNTEDIVAVSQSVTLKKQQEQEPLNVLEETEMTKTKTTTDRAFYLASVKHRGLVLQAQKCGTQVALGTLEYGNKNQIWKVVPTDTGDTCIVNVGSGSVLDVQWSRYQPLTRVINYKVMNTPNQNWEVNLGAGIISPKEEPTLVIGVSPYATKKEGSPEFGITLQKTTSDLGQLWQFVEAAPDAETKMEAATTSTSKSIYGHGNPSRCSSASMDPIQATAIATATHSRNSSTTTTSTITAVTSATTTDPETITTRTHYTTEDMKPAKTSNNCNSSCVAFTATQREAIATIRGMGFYNASDEALVELLHTYNGDVSELVFTEFIR